MKNYLKIGTLILIFLISSPASYSKSYLAPVCRGGAAPVVVFLQFNDVYEIFKQEGKARGGLARVATLKSIFEKQFPNTKVLAVLAGDFISPSALVEAKWQGKPLAGIQMIETLNALKLDVVIPGNHEFDLGPQALGMAMAESKFTYGWISSNVRGLDGGPYKGMKENLVIELPPIDPNNPKMYKLGFYSVTSDMNKNIQGKYLNFVMAAQRQVQKLKDQKVDLIIGLTHLSIADDRFLAKNVPDTDLIMGGHEHNNMFETLPTPNNKDLAHKTIIAKADGNVETVYVHVLCEDEKTKKLSWLNKLMDVDGEIIEEEKTKAIVSKWKNIAFDSLKRDGFNPDEVVANTFNSKVSLDGTDKNRHEVTNLSKIIGRSYLQVRPGSTDQVPSMSFFNAGLIRLEDRLQPGPITQYDILRIMPFSDFIFHLNMMGSTIKKIYEVGRGAVGSGDFLHWEGMPQNINDIVSSSTYRVATNGYLLRGTTRGLEFLNRNRMDVKFADIKAIQEQRKALIEQLRLDFPMGR